MGKDILGSFNIPSHLVEKASAYVPPPAPKPKVKPQNPSAFKTKFTLPYGFGNEKVIEKIKSTSSKSSKPPVHTVTGYIDNHSGKAQIKCTCQGYKIRGKGYCKHTKAMNEKYDFGAR